MGLILDSSVLIKAERQGQNARQMLGAISSQVGNTEIAISVVTLIELAHGAARADTPQRKAKRQQFIQELLLALPLHPVNRSGCSSHGTDRWRESSQRSSTSTFRPSDRRDRAGIGLQRCYRQSSTLPVNPEPFRYPVVVRRQAPSTSQTPPYSPHTASSQHPRRSSLPAHPPAPARTAPPSPYPDQPTAA